MYSEAMFRGSQKTTKLLERDEAAHFRSGEVVLTLKTGSV